MKLSLQWHKDFPDLFVQWFGPFLPEVVVTDPEFKKILLKSAGRYIHSCVANL